MPYFRSRVDQGTREQGQVKRLERGSSRSMDHEVGVTGRPTKNFTLRVTTTRETNLPRGIIERRVESLGTFFIMKKSLLKRLVT